MKTLYMIGGTMGVGKTAVCQYMKRVLPNAVFLDGDWCWDADPFQVTCETKEMVLRNIAYLLNSFLRCTAYEHIVFGWVMHEQAIIDALLRAIHAEDCEVKVVSLLATEETLRRRIMADVAKGTRCADVLERSVARLPLYASLRSIKIETDDKTIAQIATEILSS